MFVDASNTTENRGIRIHAVFNGKEFERILKILPDFQMDLITLMHMGELILSSF